jgi:hypothetical protein
MQTGEAVEKKEDKNYNTMSVGRSVGQRATVCFLFLRLVPILSKAYYSVAKQRSPCIECRA